jgi:RNA polymerase sigma-70 factor (sigma-E family)
MLYDLLDQARKRSEAALDDVRAAGGPGGTHQARLERDVSAAEHERRLTQLNGIERGLCFGRTDDEDRNTLYIGRIGLRGDDYDLKLIDWRAPAARPFYAATPGNPQGLVRRRHIYTRQRQVTGVNDEVFKLDRLTETDREGLSGEAALIAAVSSARTGRMSDVVATIQREQDRVIRSGLQGVLVVQGGPGTGKTVAALHRAAYLLYTYRRTLERRGVLVIGPNATFLRYISQVLPSLGETDVVLRTLGELFPGVRATDATDPAAVVKGDERMVEVLRKALRNRQRAPKSNITIDADGVLVPLSRDAVLRARDRARALRKPHNVARKLFVTELLTELARNEARVLDRPLEAEDLPDSRARLWEEPTVRAALDELWPPLTPQQLLADLLSEESALSSAASSLSYPERTVLLRQAHPAAWTVADVPLLDEAAELLGTDNSAQLAATRAERRSRRLEEKYAREVLQITYLPGSDVSLADLGMVDAETLAAWNRDSAPALSTADRAAADRSWAYGHVIIDEAQELSAMAWRMVLRRNPARSLTVVGDVAQTGSPAGARSWKQMLDPLVRGRWREERLTVNYRTPAEIMAVAADVLASVAPDEHPPESVRSEGVPPRAVRVPRPAPSAPEAPHSLLAACVAEVARADLAELGGPDGGRLAVIAPDARAAELAAAVPEAIRGDQPESLDSPAALLTVSQAKGLEFDRVVLADPAGLVAQSQNGGHDLYVAITRATHRLTVVYEGDLPAQLRGLTADSQSLSTRLGELPAPGVSYYVAAAQDDFTEFYKANYGRVVALVGAMVGDRHQAEDIAQEAFARALARWPRIARYDLPEAWVRRVSVRLTIDASRRRRRANLAAALLAGGRREDKPDPLASTALTLALMRLPLAQRQVVVLYYLADLPVHEIARDCGISDGAVRTRLAVAKRRLERELSEDDKEVPDAR